MRDLKVILLVAILTVKYTGTELSTGSDYRFLLLYFSSILEYIGLQFIRISVSLSQRF